MPLSENIKKQIDRKVKNGKTEIDLSNKTFLDEDVRELVELLNQYSSISLVNLSRNTLIRDDVVELARLKHVKKLTLIMSDITYADALILCANENFHELILDSRDLGQGSFDEHKKIPRTNPLKITVTRGIDFERHLDTVIILGPQQEITQHPDVTLELTAEADRKKNHSDESAESKATAPMSIEMQNTTAPDNSLTCCPLGFCWPTKRATTISPVSNQP